MTRCRFCNGQVMACGWDGTEQCLACGRTQAEPPTPERIREIRIRSHQEGKHYKEVVSLTFRARDRKNAPASPATEATGAAVGESPKEATQ